MAVVFPLIALAMFWTGCAAVYPKAQGILKCSPGRLVGRGLDTARKSKAFSAVRRIKSAAVKNRLAGELADSLAYIRNIAILGRSGSVSTRTLLEELAENSTLLQPAYLEMAKKIDIGDSDDAKNVLFDLIGEGFAKDIGEILVSWESMSSADMIQSLEVYRSMLLEQKITRIKRRDELISDLVYFPVVINCMVVLLNFLYVAYFLEQKELLSLFF